MAFASDAHRRWWFANRAAGGGSGGAGGVKFTQPVQQVDSAEAVARKRAKDDYFEIAPPPAQESQAALDRQRAKDDYFTLSESQVRQLEKDAYFEQVLEDQRFDDQANYWKGQ